MSQEVIQRITHLVDEFGSRVANAPAEAWDNQSPCAEWKARDVVSHVANNLARVAAGLHGAEPQQIDTSGDVQVAWAGARSQFVDAINAADLSQTMPGPFGPMPAADMLGQIISADTLVHTWDLARAVGGDERLDQDAVAGAYRGLQGIDAMLRRPGLFDAKIDAQDGDDLQTEFLRFLGRQV